MLEAKAKGITILKNKDHCEWEMHRDGKIFRYDMYYHLFEEVKEANNTGALFEPTIRPEKELIVGSIEYLVRAKTPS